MSGLLSVSFTVGNDVALGEYEVTLSHITFGYGFTDKDIAPNVTFKVKVVAVHTIVLDENSTTAPEAAEGVNVRVLRTIKANQWSTICLPFVMTAAQVKTAFGDDVQLADFNGCEAIFDEMEEDIVALKVNFVDVTAIEANHPYIIKVGSDIGEFVVNGIDIAPSEELSVDKDEDKYKRNGKWYYDYNSFVGTYEAGTVIPEQSLFLNGNQFWYSKGTSTSKAFRGYFSFYQILSDITNAEARISMCFDSEEMNIDAGRKATVSGGQIYDLLGTRRSVALRKGIYIQNGKKVVVK